MNNQHNVFIFVDDEPVEIEMAPEEIMVRAAINPEHHYLVLLRGEEHPSYKDNAELPIALHCSDRFITHLRLTEHPSTTPTLSDPAIEFGDHHLATIQVDGNTFTIELTPKEILLKAGLDPHKHYLELEQDGDNLSYKDSMEQPIAIHCGDRFLAPLLGRTTVSFLERQGPERFETDLKELGWVTECKNDRVFFSYTIRSGPFKSKTVRIALPIPADFPRTAPTGLHVSPCLLPFQDGGQHPRGGITKSDLGQDWQYWSRKHDLWDEVDRTTRQYLFFIQFLFATQ